MIQANELRIGNWVKHSINKYWIEEYQGKIVQIHFDVLKDIVISDDVLYDPIPLTHEILEKAGFELQQTFGLFYELEINGWRIRPDCKHVRIIEDDDSDILVPCATLHQLQNLIFALTGSELQINL